MAKKGGYLQLKGVRDRTDLVIKTCIVAGKILIANGSEISRVYGTLKRIIAKAQVPDLRIYASITAIIISANLEGETQMEEIDHRSFNLRKITVVNDLSRQYCEGHLSLYRFYQELKKVNSLNNFFPYWLKALSAGILAGSIEVVFMGDFSVFFITCLVGLLGWALFDFLNRFVRIEFINEFIAAMTIALLALLARRIGIGNSVDNIIIGSLMPLVPGVQITNAMSDLMAGNIISGPARGIEAIMCSIALGFGVALVLTCFG